MENKALHKDSHNRNDFGPLSFWAWNDDMNDESIKQRLKEFHSQGIQGFFMHARSGNLTPYLSSEWFRACKTSIQVAKEYGMQVWLYDEDGWPSGFGGGVVNGKGERYWSKYLAFTDKKDEADFSRLLGMYKKTTNGYTRTQADDACLWMYYKVEPNYVDLLSKEVTACFIESTHETYKREIGKEFGETVRGIFTDEPQYNHAGYPFSLELEAYFRTRNGYSFVDNAHYLFLPVANMSQSAQAFLLDYWSTVEEMMRINFSKQIFDWCEANQLQFTGHYPGEDSLIQQMVSTAGVMPKYEYMHIPGIDHLGRRVTPILLTKQVASAAKQFGKKKILSETFGCAGWNISFSQMCAIWGWQAVAGINVPCLHIGAHSMKGIRKRDYPAFYSYQEPWWSDFHHVAKWMEGLNYKLSLGCAVEDVLVISPRHTMYLYHRNTYSEQEQMYAASYRQLLENLMDIQVPFDLGDEVILEKYGKVNGANLLVGNCSYRIVIVSRAAMLEKSTWNLLEGFQKNGGTVVFTDGMPQAPIEMQVDVGGTVVPNRLGFWFKYFEKTHFNRKIKFLTKDGFHIADGLQMAIREDDSLKRCYVWSRSQYGARSLRGQIDGNKVCYRVDPETFEKEVLTTIHTASYTQFTLELEGEESALLEFVDGEPFSQASRLLQYSRLDGSITLGAPNSLTLDYASFSFDGIAFSQPMQIVHLHKALYAALPEHPGAKVFVRYRFENRDTNAQDMAICVESEKAIDLLCNGYSILGNQNGYYMDECITKYDISGQLKVGTNEIMAVYHIDSADTKDVDGLFETEKNRFFYPVEPEAIYLLGNFDVGFVGVQEETPTHMSIAQAHFYITQPTAKHSMDNLTKLGLWFYRGDVIYGTSITKTDHAQHIRIEGLQGALAVVQINGNAIALYRAPHRADISHLLQPGKNDVVIRLIGTNRNLLGPHHHIKGENNYVGPNTFKGEYGYEDNIVNHDIAAGQKTWTDSYSFVEFGWSGVYLEEWGYPSK